jgi:molybdate transport system substrate-binding protein
VAKRYLLGVLAVILVGIAAVGLSSNASEIGGEAAPEKTEIMVSAAASLQNSLDIVAADYEKAHPGIKLVFNYGASGTLQKQIEQGAPADLFLSAGEKQMDALVKGGFIEDHAVLLKNQLVMIVPSDFKAEVTALTQLTDSIIKRVAIGQPESVPAGQYAKEALTATKAWEPLQNKLVYAKDVRQVLSYVETGNADAGFVYKTDALTSKKVAIALTAGEELHQPIHYPVGIIDNSQHQEEAEAFYRYLQSEEAEEIFASNGFLIP